MAKGGYRPGAGRPKGSTNKSTAKSTGEIPADAKQENLTPLEYMLKVMQDPTTDPARRDRMAIAAAPFCHRKAEDGGKKEKAAAAAKKAATGRFAPAPPPGQIVPMWKK